MNDKGGKMRIVVQRLDHYERLSKKRSGAGAWWSSRGSAGRASLRARRFRLREGLRRPGAPRRGKERKVCIVVQEVDHYER